MCITSTSLILVQLEKHVIILFLIRYVIISFVLHKDNTTGPIPGTTHAFRIVSNPLLLGKNVNPTRHNDFSMSSRRSVVVFSSTNHNKIRTSSNLQLRKFNHHRMTINDINQLTSCYANNPYNIVIVGGGVGGLAIASRIAASLNKSKKNSDDSRPYQITILEKNTNIGGRCGSFYVELPSFANSDSNDTTNSTVLRFRHERGPSLLLLPQIYQDLFQETKQCTSETYGLQIAPCNPAYQIIFDDGDTITVGYRRSKSELISNDEQLSRTKMDSYEPDGSSKWDQYMKLCEAYLDCGLPNFIEERFDLGSFPAFIQQSIIQNTGQGWPLKAHSKVIDSIFESNKLRVVASFQDLYVGLEPYANPNKVFDGVWTTTAPAVFGLLSAIELHPTNTKCGVYAPIGGFESVTTSLQQLAADFNVTIQDQSTVTTITEQGVYYCNTTTNGNEDRNDNQVKFHAADLIIVNADLPYSTKVLIDNGETFETEDETKSSKNGLTYDWDDTYLYSSGVIAFHWSLSRSLDELNTHNVFMCANSRTESEQSWDILRNSQTDMSSFFETQQPFNFYVHRASATDPTAAPPGMDALLVLVPCPTLQRDERLGTVHRSEAINEYGKQFSDENIAKVKESVLRRMAVSSPDIANLILHEVVDTPVTYADQYNVGAGTPFGLSHGFGQLSITRPTGRSAFSKKNQNIFYCGASTRPGNGVPLVLTGAKLIAKQVIDYIQRDQ